MRSDLCALRGEGAWRRRPRVSWAVGRGEGITGPVRPAVRAKRDAKYGIPWKGRDGGREAGRGLSTYALLLKNGDASHPVLTLH